jgi:hypothetical protein
MSSPTSSTASSSIDGLSVALAVIYTLLHVVTSVQLARIVYNRQHKTISFQSGFLFLCFCWTFFRALFFTVHSVDPGDGLFNSCSDDIVFTAPVPVQCATYSLLIFFFAWNVNKSSWGSVKELYVTCAVTVNLLYFSWCNPPVFLCLACSSILRRWIAIRSVVCEAGDNPSPHQQSRVNVGVASCCVTSRVK